MSSSIINVAESTRTCGPANSEIDQITVSATSGEMFSTIHRESTSDQEDPAIRRINGTKYWYEEGQLRSVVGIAEEGRVIWWYDRTQARRIVGHTVTHPDGTEHWYDEGEVVAPADMQ